MYSEWHPGKTEARHTANGQDVVQYCTVGRMTQSEVTARGRTSNCLSTPAIQSAAPEQQ